MPRDTLTFAARAKGFWSTHAALPSLALFASKTWTTSACPLCMTPVNNVVVVQWTADLTMHHDALTLAARAKGVKPSGVALSVFALSSNTSTMSASPLCRTLDRSIVSEQLASQHDDVS